MLSPRDFKSQNNWFYLIWSIGAIGLELMFSWQNVSPPLFTWFGYFPMHIRYPRTIKFVLTFIFCGHQLLLASCGRHTFLVFYRHHILHYWCWIHVWHQNWISYFDQLRNIYEPSFIYLWIMALSSYIEFLSGMYLNLVFSSCFYLSLYMKKKVYSGIG